jgi:hypothetical protein
VLNARRRPVQRCLFQTIKDLKSAKAPCHFASEYPQLLSGYAQILKVGMLDSKMSLLLASRKDLYELRGHCYLLMLAKLSSLFIYYLHL